MMVSIQVLRDKPQRGDVGLISLQIIITRAHRFRTTHAITRSKERVSPQPGAVVSGKPALLRPEVSASTCRHSGLMKPRRSRPTNRLPPRFTSRAARLRSAASAATTTATTSAPATTTTTTSAAPAAATAAATAATATATTASTAQAKAERHVTARHTFQFLFGKLVFRGSRRQHEIDGVVGIFDDVDRHTFRCTHAALFQHSCRIAEQPLL